MTKLPPQTLEGTYKLLYIDAMTPVKFFTEIANRDGKTLEEVLSSFNLTENTADQFVVVKLDPDGKGSATYAGETGEITWTRNGDTVTINSTDIDYRDGKLYFRDMGGVEYVLRK